MRRRLIILGAAAVLAAAALLFGGAFRTGTPHRAAAAGAAPPAKPTTVATIDRLEAALRVDPRDARSWAELGLAYEQRARETSDPSYYTKADRALRRALRISPRDLAATTGIGSLALSRHRFREALRYGRVARRLAPDAAAPHAIVGDALLELGRYAAAFRSFETLASLKPGVAAYARISYARELLGQTRGAIEAMRLAATTAAGDPDQAAWTHWQLGKLYWSIGRLGAAASEYRTALAVSPGYAAALDALADVEAARGRPVRALELARRAVEANPASSHFRLGLAGMYDLTGQARRAELQYRLVVKADRLLAAHGARTALETALVQADRGVRLRQTLALARQAQRERPSIDGDDVLAWALQRNGRCAEALRFSRRALRLGTRDALKFFHRGMIERCLGRRAIARTWFAAALKINPYFSLQWAPVARAALRQPASE